MDLEPPAVFLLGRQSVWGNMSHRDANQLRGDWREEVEERVTEREKQQKHTRRGDAGTGNLSRIVAT